ncbi:tetratricopeptide repeat protein [Halobacillus seohaensis]|uniref:Tetratricopeptide repeat protein n=1 Tax=Halobacillus seohaensis TaxID=447421 RepID=A0ABW2EDS8_9BACI
MEEIHKAIQAMEAEKTEEALTILQEYLPEADEEERFTITELYIQWGLLEDAKMLLQELMERYPKEQELKVMMAEIHIDLNEDADAINLLNEFNPEDEGYLESLLQLADLYQSQGLFEVAEQKLLSAKQIEPNEAVIDFGLGELAFSNGEYNKCIPFYENAMHHQPVIAEIEVATRLAEAFAANGEFEKSLEYFQKVEEDNPDVMFRYGFVAFQALRNDIAIHVWERLIDEDPYFQSVYPLLAQAYETEGMPQEALEMAKQGLAKDEYNKELYHLAGTLSHKSGDIKSGYNYMREAVALDPGYKEAVLFLIENYKSDGDNESIIELINQLITLGEEDPGYLFELAKAYEEEEDFGQALEYYRSAYPSLKEDDVFLKAYGYFLIEEGKMEEGQKVLEEYLLIDPSNTEVEEFINRLKEK